MPRIALLSDIHGNLSALNNVIHVLEDEHPDLWICLGDIVGYGPFASECIDIVRERSMICVKGNHDAGVTGELTLKHFRNPNRKLIEQTKKELATDQIDWLKSLPYTSSEDEWLAVHASPEGPERWEYVESAYRARSILSNIDQNICFLGHTHKPALISDRLGSQKFERGYKYIINPGSVGQSRDGDYRASCALVDTDVFQYTNFRVEFDQEENLSALMKKGFSRKEAHHLLRY